MTIFYTYLLSTRIDPSSCPKSIGDYGVIAGQTGNVLNTCNGPCKFLVPSLTSAVSRCDGDDRCRAFYYDGLNMEYIELGSPLMTAMRGGLYIRQRNITT